MDQVRLEWIDAGYRGTAARMAHRHERRGVACPAAAEEIEHALAAVAWPEVLSPTGLKGLWSRAVKGHSAGQAVREAGRAAIRAAITPHVIDPTEMIHEAYRNLDELADLS